MSGKKNNCEGVEGFPRPAYNAEGSVSGCRRPGPPSKRWFWEGFCLRESLSKMTRLSTWTPLRGFERRTSQKYSENKYARHQSPLSLDAAEGCTEISRVRYRTTSDRGSTTYGVHGLQRCYSSGSHTPTNERLRILQRNSTSDVARCLSCIHLLRGTRCSTHVFPYPRVVYPYGKEVVWFWWAT